MFDSHQSIHGPETDELDFDAFPEGAERLVREFAESDEGQIIIARAGSVCWAGVMMDYAMDYLGVTPPRMSAGNFEEVVFGIFPRKVSAQPSDGPSIITELRAFWQFLQRVYQLKNAGKILALLDDRAAARLQKKMADPRNFGMAKSFMMMGQQLGFDMGTEEGLQAFMSFYNRRLSNGPAASQPLPIAMNDQGDDESDDDYVNDFDDGFGEPEPLVPGLTPKERADMRKKKRKAQRQARKRARRH